MLAKLLALGILLFGQVTDLPDEQLDPLPVQDAADVTLQIEEPSTPAPSAQPSTTTAANSSTDLGAWLVHLARHQGHLVGRSDPRSASLHVIALLESATVAAPDCAEAYYWLYDLHLRMGRSQAARTALSRYVRLAPMDDGARLKRLDIELAERQTADARYRFVQDELQQKPMTRIYESALRGWLARHHYEREEREPAGREVETALRLNPMNVAAREVAYELFGETEPELQRVELALQMISINPSQVNLVWDLAEFLDRISLHKQAQEWYNRAIDLHRRAEAGPIAADLWQKLAISYVCSEDYAKAVEAADEALKADESLHSARLLRAHARRKLGDEEAAAEDETIVQKAYEGRLEEMLEKAPEGEAAQIAWYYCYHKLDTERALKLSEKAMKARAPSDLAKLAYGYALSANGRVDEAMDLLRPLAATDQLAALELARCMIQRGEKSEGITLLHKAASIQYSGIAYKLIRDLLEKYGEKAGEPPLHSKIVAALDRFPRDVFDYYRRTADFMKFTLRFESSELPPVGPVNVVLRLENTAPFIITLGEGFMARPLVAISARLGPPVSAEFTNYLQVLLSERPVLVPGDAVEKIVAIDVGPIRENLILTATQELSIELTAMFDPVYHEGKLAPGLGTVTAGPISATRKAIPWTGTARTDLIDQAMTGDMAIRTHAVDAIGGVLAALQSRKFGEPAIDRDPEAREAVTQLQGALARLLGDRDERVRAHAIVAAGWSTLSDELTRPAAPSVQDERPLIRVLAVRLFAAKQGDAFRKVLEHIAQSDAHQAVRTMAASYLPDDLRVRAEHGSHTNDPPVP